MENFLKFIKVTVFCILSFKVCLASHQGGNSHELTRPKDFREIGDLSKKETALLKMMRERNSNSNSFSSTEAQPDIFSQSLSLADDWDDVPSQESTPDARKRTVKIVNASNLFDDDDQGVIEAYVDGSRTLRTVTSIQNLRKELAHSRRESILFTYKSKLGEMDVHDFGENSDL